MHAINSSQPIQALYNKVQTVITEIDLIVFVPIEDPDLISCLESELPKLRSRVNEILNEWVWDFGVETIEVKGTVSERRDQILSKIVQE